ncbi:MAG: hypothetical protein ABMB14_30705 [Myxococcota bacterium]
MRWVVSLCVVAAGCVPSIRPLYDAAHDAALADPGPPPAGWTPDAVVALSPPLVEAVLEAAIDAAGPLTAPIAVGPARVTPEIHLRSLAVAPARPCDGGCVGLDAEFGGSLGWSIGPVSGSTPLTARGALDAAFTLERDAGGFVVQVAPRRLRDVSVDVGGLEAQLQGIRRSVRATIEREAVARIPPQPIARFPRAGLPIRAGRLVAGAGDGAVRVELLTVAPVGAAVPAAAGDADLAPDDGFAVTIATDTLLALARAEAFRHGVVAHGVVPEPVSLAFDRDGFTLGLRLWRIEGHTWWRDYTIAGATRIANGKLTLTPSSVTEGDRSKGAAIADPLAALAEGLILRAIEDAVTTSLPLHAAQKVGAAPVSVVLTALEPGPSSVRATGTVTIGRPGR